MLGHEWLKYICTGNLVRDLSFPQVTCIVHLNTQGDAHQHSLLVGDADVLLMLEAQGASSIYARA